MTPQTLVRCAVALFAAVVFLYGSAMAQEIPAQIQAPAGEQLFLTVHGKGDQIYTCKEGVTRLGWELKAPDAQLFFTDDKPFGKHYAGPTWEANDGSRVAGKAIATVPSTDPDSIPWLLIQIVSHEGTGVLSRATSVQRIRTKGGKAPASGCDSANAGKEIRVPYTADYLFYAPK
ncbi:MAG: DUF3455 domain-containing protein [Candidatus Acidiferrum sp.]